MYTEQGQTPTRRMYWVKHFYQLKGGNLKERENVVEHKAYRSETVIWM